jgi:hypothetical protein
MSNREAALGESEGDQQGYQTEHRAFDCPAASFGCFRILGEPALTQPAPGFQQSEHR